MLLKQASGEKQAKEELTTDIDKEVGPNARA
jgi:hypothetical protein